MRRVHVALLALLALVGASCGARLSEEQLASARSDNGGGSSSSGSGTSGGTAGSGASGGSGASAGSGATGGSGSSAGSGATGGGGGTGGGGTEDGGATGGTCTPQPSEEVGVTDTEIVLGNVSTITGPVAGFGATGLAGTRAYIEYINSQGGVCGRTLRLETADDRLDTGVNRAEALRLSEEVIGFVGGTSVVDGGTASALEGTNIASTSLAVSNGAVASPNIFSSSPIDPTGQSLNTTPIWNYFKASRGVTKVAIVYPAQADARARALQFVVEVEAAGLEVDGPYEVSITETNYVNVAQQIENNGADGVITALEITGMARLAQAFAQIQFTPKVAYYGSQAYGQKFIELAGDAANGTSIGVAYSIFEDAPNNPAIASFLEWYERVAPGSDPDFFALIAWAATDMMVQALEAAGPAPTRDAVMSFLRGLTVFDAHGAIAPCNPAGKIGSDQFVIVNIENGQWVREHPASGYATS